MSVLMKNERKLCFMIHKEWAHKTKPLEAVKKINKAMDKDNFITSTQIHYWYKEFSDGLVNIYINKFFSVQRSLPKSFLDPILLANKTGQCVLTSNGRFLVSSHYFDNLNRLSVTVHDLFLQTKRKTYVKVNTFKINFGMVGEYLCIFGYSENARIIELHAIKINYDDLGVEKFNIVKICGNFSHEVKIVPDQFNNEKFVIYDKENVMTGKIHGTEIILGERKSFKKHHKNLFGGRLIGNKLQGFIRDIGSPMEFCEFDLETMETKSKYTPIKLDNSKLHVIDYPEKSSWSNDRFYSFHVEKWIERYQLLSFDPKILKWSVIQIYTSMPPKTMYIDENEMLTFYVREFDVDFYYRVALRKPDLLVNLTLLVAARELDLYGNDKYIKCAKKIPIQL